MKQFKGGLYANLGNYKSSLPQTKILNVFFKQNPVGYKKGGEVKGIKGVNYSRIPVTGGFITGDSSVYLYTGVEGQYGLGPLKILPSFAPGYYEKGDGKDLGSVLEFKSEIKVGLDIFENSKLSYSYSHLSNNDWGNTNPGTDNQQITFSKNF